VIVSDNTGVAVTECLDIRRPTQGGYSRTPRQPSTCSRSRSAHLPGPPFRGPLLGASEARRVMPTARDPTATSHDERRRSSAPCFAHGLPIETENHVITQRKRRRRSARSIRPERNSHIRPAAPISIPECGYTEHINERHTPMQDMPRPGATSTATPPQSRKFLARGCRKTAARVQDNARKTQHRRTYPYNGAN